MQDGGLLEMSDMGNCMSMHQVSCEHTGASDFEMNPSFQPLASLLVMGIKIHEGRTWYSQVWLYNLIIVQNQSVQCYSASWTSLDSCSK